MAESYLVFVLGGPGSGKRTQCARIAKDGGWTHISTTEHIFAEMKRGSEYGIMIKKHVDEAKNVPAWLISRVIGKAILDKPSRKYIIDGFPRELSQVDTFFKLARDADSVVYFNTPDAVLKQRALARAGFGDNEA